MVSLVSPRLDISVSSVEMSLCTAMMAVAMDAWFSVASVWPAVTVSPLETSTVSTVRPAGTVTLVVVPLAIVPEPVTVVLTLPLVAVACCTVVVVVFACAFMCTIRNTTPATTSTTAAAMAINTGFFT